MTEARFGTAELTQFCNDLIAAMKGANGAGIAAPQVFPPRSCIIITFVRDRSPPVAKSNTTEGLCTARLSDSRNQRVIYDTGSE